MNGPMAFGYQPATPSFLPLVIGIIFLLVFVFFAVISMFLNYHWHKYEVSPARTRIQRRVYFGVAGVLLISMTFFAVLAVWQA